MMQTLEIKRPSAARPTPAPSQAFLTTPSPRCYEKVVRKRGPGLGGCEVENRNIKNVFKIKRKETTRRRARGKSQKQIGIFIMNCAVINFEIHIRQIASGLFPLSPRLEATIESFHTSRVQIYLPRQTNFLKEVI